MSGRLVSPGLSENKAIRLLGTWAMAEDSNAAADIISGSLGLEEEEIWPP